MTKYIIWRFDKKTKVPTLMEKGDRTEEAILNHFKGHLKDTENSFAIRINR